MRDKTEKVFKHNSANSLRRKLDRAIRSLKLPKESSIKVENWHSHSLRTSKLTQLRNEDWKLEKIMKVSGHKNLNSLQKYIKVDDEEVFQDQLRRL